MKNITDKVQGIKSKNNYLKNKIRYYKLNNMVKYKLEAEI